MTTIDNAGGPTHALGDAADNDLVLRSRSGDRAAFGELWRRHYRSGLAVAHSMTASLEADDLVQEAFARIYQSILRGGGPTGSFRAYLFTSIRNTAAGWGRARRESATDELETVEDPASSEQATAAALDRSITVRAFRSLSSRWQEVLWYSEIERMKPAEIAPLLGMNPTAVAQLTFRAREGLREAWIQAHLQSVEDGSDCQWTIGRLGAFARSNLGARDRAKAVAHLATCARCSIVAAEAREVSRHLTAVLIPLIVGITGTAAYLAAVQGGGVPLAALAAMPSGVFEGAIVVHGSAGVAGVAGTAAAAASATGAAGAAASAGAAGVGAGAAGAGLGVGAAGAGAAGAGAVAAGTTAVGAGLVGSGTLGAAAAGATAATAGAMSAGAAAATTAAVTTVAASTVAATAAATATGGVLSTITGMIGLVTASAVLVGTVAAGAALPSDEVAPPSSVQQAEAEAPAAPIPGDIGFLVPAPATATDITLPGDSTITVEPVSSDALRPDSTILSYPIPADPAPVDPLPVNPAPVDPLPVNPAPVEPLPVNPAPVEPLPVNPAPVEPLPVNPAPVEPLPVNPAPVEPLPVNPAPVEPLPVNPAPVDPIPADSAAADAAPQDPASVDPAPSDPPPADPVVADPVSEDPTPAPGGEETTSGEDHADPVSDTTAPGATDPDPGTPDPSADATGDTSANSGTPADALEPTDVGAMSLPGEGAAVAAADLSPGESNISADDLTGTYA